MLIRPTPEPTKHQKVSFMRKMSYLSRYLLAALPIAALSGCASVMPSAGKNDYQNYQNEFTSTNVYSRAFPGSAQTTCEAARRALLSQGYVINEASDSLVRGRKNFQPNSDVHMQVEFHVVCAENSKGSNSTTLFANAVRDRYSLKKSSNSASLGVGVLGSVSLPFGSVDDSLVRVGSETIPNRKFYDRFFEVVETYLDFPGSADDINSNDTPSSDPAASGSEDDGS